MKKILALLAAGLMVGLIINGCGTDDPASPDQIVPLILFITSAPDTTTSVTAYSTVNFFWNSAGGIGDKTYQWYLSPLETAYNDAANLQTIAYDSLANDTTIAQLYTFYLIVEDEEGETDSAQARFYVSPYEAPAADTTAPTVEITESPVEGSYVATGSSIVFVWAGDDGNGNDDELTYKYAFPTLADSSESTQAVSVSFSDVAAASPAWFYVRAEDQAGNLSAWDSLSFIIQDATILYIDDYEWLDGWGNRDLVKEQDQKEFYRTALEGYAFAEWDIALQGIPDSSDLVDGGTPIYSTIIYAADSEVGTTSGNAWTYFGDSDNGKGYSMRYYLEQGGNLMLAGALALLDMTQSYPPAVTSGDFEFDWLGIDSTEWSLDYWSDLTWVVKDAATTLDLPDSMKIDVAKNGDQVDYGTSADGLRNEATVTTEIIFVWGLDIDGSPTGAYGQTIGHITKWSGTARTALLGFDLYSMPEESIRQTFQAILTEFGE